MASKGQEQVQPPLPRQPTPVQHQPPLGEIHVISGGFVGGGESSSARKAYLRNIRSGETLEVQIVSKLPRLDTTITFSDFDMEGCQHPHDDPFVIKTIVADRPKAWCVKCTPMFASARVAPSNIVYQWYGYRSTGIGVLNTEICFSKIIWIYVLCERVLVSELN